LLLENPSSNTDLLEFGQEEQAEQLLQILYSYEIKMRIIKKYNLLKHYDIDSTSKYKMTRLFSQFKNNITFRRNEFMAVEINVLDKDPQYAADIANDIAALVDTEKKSQIRLKNC
jgi:capsular polysaccharide biosynthesis protein